MKPRLSDHVIGIALMVTYIGLLLVASLDQSMSRDESFYVVAAENYARWFEQFAEDPGEAVTEESIRRGWEYNHEHPGLTKSLFALSLLAHRAWDIFPTEAAAHRFPAMVHAGLILYLLFLFGIRLKDRSTGLAAALLFAAIPRVFYHSQLNCFDMPIVSLMLLTTYWYWLSLESKRYGIATGVAYGLALGTKHNAWILLGILIIHFVWIVLAERQRRREGGETSISLFPTWLIACLTLGPLVFVLTWPWLWHEGFSRFGWYAGFHISHVHYTIEYLGKTYFEPPFPMHVPLVGTLLTVQLVTLGLGLVGVAMNAPRFIPERIGKYLRLSPPTPRDPRRTHVLLIGSLVAPMLVIALPNSPIFGGTKHWIPSYPFLCLYAGLACSALITYLQRAQPSRAKRGVLAVLVISLFATPAIIETVRSHPFGLAHYTALGGGVPGAADLGMNRIFWGSNAGQAGKWLSEHKPRARIFLGDTTGKAWDVWTHDGGAPRTIRGANSIDSSSAAIVQMEPHFIEVDLDVWQAYGSVKPVDVVTHQGVPIITVYARD